tara:strand:- start:534 stop:941 length:408 start_codon:yes stop_codon:yes gene_type:complete
MKDFTTKRVESEHKKLPGSILTKNGENWIITTPYKNKIFKFYMDENYPFEPPIKLYCNGKDMKQCSMTKYCYACHSIICERNWSPSMCLYTIMNDYINKLRESELRMEVALVARRILPQTPLPPELTEHICSFIF